MRPAMRIAIYDLDKTLTRKATFTPFLFFAARRMAPWRTLLLPVWILQMMAYKAGLMDRTTLKRRGMKLMLGRASVAGLQEIGRQFAELRVANDGLMPGALRLLEDDRQSGAVIAVATAAFGFYASSFAAALGIEHVIATQWDGADIPGGNCYGETKKRRLLSWLEMMDIDLASTEIRFVSDSFADAPLLDMVQEPIFVTSNPAKAQRAVARGWCAMDLS